MKKQERKNQNLKIFLKAAFLTAIAIFLVVLGVIAVNYLLA